MIQQPNTRSNKYNHLDKVFNANYFAAIKAGYNPALAGAAAFAAVRNVLFNRVYGYGKTKTLVESGFESNDDDNLLHDYRLIVDNTPENPWPWFPGAPNDPFHWQTKTVLEYREKVYSALKYLERKQAQAQPRQMPACRKPGPPRELTAVYDDNEAVIEWNPPSDEGSAGPITSYNISRYHRDTSWQPLQPPPGQDCLIYYQSRTSRLSVTDCDAQPAESHRFWYAVRAHNRAGPGPWSRAEPLIISPER